MSLLVTRTSAHPLGAQFPNPPLPWWVEQIPVMSRPTPVLHEGLYAPLYKLQMTHYYAPFGLHTWYRLTVFPRPWEGRLMFWLCSVGLMDTTEGGDMRWSHLTLNFPRVLRERREAQNQRELGRLVR